MKILVLGGTGAMGIDLVEILAGHGEDVTVTSRAFHESPYENVKYIQGNARDNDFLQRLLVNVCYDVIVDFMLYSVDEFRQRHEKILRSCKQYIFFSSARVYAPSDSALNETSARLLDVTSDKEFLATGEYSLTKAKQEDILKKSQYGNWVIIRPYKTYSNNRLQLGVLEMEQWIYRAVSGKAVVALGNIEHLHTSLTYSGDTAKILNRIIGDYSINGEIYQIANTQRITWGEIIQIYSQCIEERYGKNMNICYVNDTSDIELLLNNKYRIKYDGLVDRIFDDSKIVSLMGEGFQWTSAIEGLTRCLDFALNQNSLPVNYGIEGMFDKYTGENTNLLNIAGSKNRLTYCLYRNANAKTIKRLKTFIHR